MRGDVVSQARRCDRWLVVADSPERTPTSSEPSQGIVEQQLVVIGGPTGQARLTVLTQPESLSADQSGLPWLLNAADQRAGGDRHPREAEELGDQEAAGCGLHKDPGEHDYMGIIDRDEC